MSDPRSAEEELGQVVQRLFDEYPLAHRDVARIRAWLSSGVLTVDAVRRALHRFVVRRWSESLEEGEITSDELDRLDGVVRTLGLPPTALPDEVKTLLALRSPR